MVGISVMKKTLIIAALLALDFVTCRATVVEGRVTSEKHPMAEVIVTDGLHFTVTDKTGEYHLDAPDNADFVYLLTPKGYVCDYSSGTPQFYQPIEKGKSRYDFQLYPMKGNPEKTVMLATADPQLDTQHDIDRLFAETLPDMRDVLAKYSDRQQTAFMAGDLTWDVYKNNEEVKRFAREVGIPFYPVIGNHDFDKYMVPAEGADYAHLYKKDFGPTYYAFEFGDTYYVVLNDIKYTGNKRYTLGLDQGNQMEWLRGLLKMVLQQDNNVTIVMHAPLKTAGGSLIEGGDELMRMLLGKPFHAAIFSGHLHTNSVYDLGNGVYEYNMGALCGYWWTSDVSGDGTPNGYKIILADGKDWEQIYKSTKHDTDYQFEVYPKGVIADRPNAVCCKIWNWDDRWTVSWYEDGKPMGRMSQFYSFAPEYLAYLDGRLAVEDYTPKRTAHYFSAVPDSGSKEITVVAEDAYGNKFTKTIKNE